MSHTRVLTANSRCASVSGCNCHLEKGKGNGTENCITHGTEPKNAKLSDTQYITKTHTRINNVGVCGQNNQSCISASVKKRNSDNNKGVQCYNNLCESKPNKNLDDDSVGKKRIVQLGEKVDNNCFACDCEVKNDLDNRDISKLILKTRSNKQIIISYDVLAKYLFIVMSCIFAILFVFLNSIYIENNQGLENITIMVNSTKAEIFKSQELFLKHLTKISHKIAAMEKIRVLEQFKIQQHQQQQQQQQQQKLHQQQQQLQQQQHDKNLFDLNQPIYGKEHELKFI
jgi:hypothetical protein